MAVAICESQLWAAFSSHSADYAAALRLNAKDLVQLSGAGPGLSMYPGLREIADKASVIDVALCGRQSDSNEFVISCKRVCGAHYGSKWGDFLFAVCISDPSLNTKHGRGVALINVLPEGIHQEICRYLKHGRRLAKYLPY